MVNDKGTAPATTMALLFLCSTLGVFLGNYFMTSMHAACPCCTTERWWPFRFISLLASTTIAVFVFSVLRRVLVRLAKRKE
jgi:hypothetical protein